MNEADLKLRTGAFAPACMKLAGDPPNSHSGRIAAGQLAACGTSAGARHQPQKLAQPLHGEADGLTRIMTRSIKSARARTIQNQKSKAEKRT